MSSSPPGPSLPGPPPGGSEPPVRIGIRTSPSDGADFLMLALLVVIGVAIAVIPMALAGAGPRGLLVGIVMISIGGVILITYAVVNVTAVVVDGHGIRLHRWHGWDRVLAWDQIDAIRRVTRGEAIWAAFVTPWRATHWGLSMREVFCIQWGGRRFYFPPSDTMLFRQAVRRWRPSLLPPEPAAGNAPPRPETGNPYQPPAAG